MGENLETFSLLWLNTLADSSEKNYHTCQQLRSTINHIRIIEDVETCEQFIRHSSDDRIVLIISGESTEEFLNRIHDLQQVRAIYVHCTDQQQRDSCVTQPSKVRAVFAEFDSLIAQVQNDQTKRNKIEESFSIGVLQNIEGEQEKSSLDINGAYLRYQLLIDVLIRMNPSRNDRDELVELCKKEYQGNSLQCNILNEFERTYSSDQAIWWYTRESFLYRILNKAFRIQNIDLLFLFRFFIRDMHRELEELQQNQSKHPIRVYRGQLLMNNELAVLANSVGKIIAMSSFFSTSCDRNYALFLLGDLHSVDDHVKRALFEIDADPGIQNLKSFANVSEKSFFGGEEQEVLFMAGSIFRVTDIKEVNGLWTIGLVLCKEEENDVRSLYNYMSKNKERNTTLLTLGTALSESGRFDQAERFFRRMLRELPADDYSSLAESYQGLSVLFAERGDYETSLTWGQKALELLEQNLSPDDPDIGFSYNNMGIAYLKLDRPERALESFNKAVKIFEKTGDKNHDHSIAACYTNLGLIRKREKKYEEALDYFHASLALNEKLLPSDHHSLAETHCNIGTVYKFLGLFDIALEHFNRSLHIYLRSLPLEHRNVAIVYSNMGLIYEADDDLNLALFYYEKASTIFHKTLPSQHSQVALSDSYLQRVKSKLSK